MTPRVEEVREDDDDPLEAAARRLLEGPRRPDAVYGLYELAAIAVLRRATELGIKVPEELMVAGPGDFGVAVKTTPQMTTLEYDVEGQGRAAACMLIRLIRGAPVEEPQQIVDFSIVERDSTRR